MSSFTGDSSTSHFALGPVSTSSFTGDSSTTDFALGPESSSSVTGDKQPEIENKLTLLNSVVVRFFLISHLSLM